MKKTFKQGGTERAGPCAALNMCVLLKWNNLQYHTYCAIYNKLWDSHETQNTL